MKLGTCIRTCSPGIAYYEAGREYLVDENEPLVKRCFTFPEDEVPQEEPPAPIEEAPKPKRSRKQ